jgi:hypothetical protein
MSAGVEILLLVVPVMDYLLELLPGYTKDELESVTNAAISLDEGI